jgi:DNA-directed RNA polymerase subunit beta
LQKENILLTKKRKSFRDTAQSVTEIPDLLSVQKESFNLLIQADLSSKDRDNIGLEKVFRASFPIDDYNNRAQLEYESYRVEPPKYSIAECKLKGYNYQSAIHVKFNLCTWEYDLDENDNPILDTKRVKDIKQQEVFFWGNSYYDT